MAEAIKEIDLGPVKGPKGDKGDPGERGPEGPIGPQGKDGVVDANTAITFTQAAQRQNIASGEKFGTILGKVAKFFADLKTHAFEAPIQNLTTNVAGKALDAIMGKKLKDEIDALNSALDTKVESSQLPNMNADKMMPTSNMVKFFIVSDSTGTTSNNFPVAGSGLLVSANLYNIHYLQIFFPLSSKVIYLRGYRQNESWSSWAPIS